MEIKFENVSFEYNKINYIKKEVLNNINLKFKKGQINAIIGSPSSGKTTLLELIDALISPTDGKIKIDNLIINKNKKNLNINDLRFNIGFVFQFPEEQFFNTSVKKELEVEMILNDYKLDDINKRVSDALKMVNLDDSYLNKNPFDLSSSEKRKLALAQSLILNPKVLILDEPTIGLDYKEKKDFVKLLRLLKKRYNKTIIISTKDIDLLHSFVDYIFILDNKKIVAEGTKYEIFKDEKLLSQYEINQPKVIEFATKVLNKKNIKIGYRDDINDLIKDIYRYVK
ncbi:MAG: ATP-binding cassette domain-containing protein [Bacilli bacterium]|nr:ATP-binding cassette domain-containing protein [Bacilli bacterium]